MWICFQRLGILGIPTSSAIFGEVVRTTDDSSILVNAPFGNVVRAIIFRADGRKLGNWKADGENGSFVISAVSPGPPPDSVTRQETDGKTTLTTKFR